MPKERGVKPMPFFSTMLCVYFLAVVLFERYACICENNAFMTIVQLRSIVWTIRGASIGINRQRILGLGR
jgi:hypothetical protein